MLRSGVLSAWLVERVLELLLLSVLIFLILAATEHPSNLDLVQALSETMAAVLVFFVISGYIATTAVVASLRWFRGRNWHIAGNTLLYGAHSTWIMLYKLSTIEDRDQALLIIGGGMLVVALIAWVGSNIRNPASHTPSEMH
jgi:hypothetical protein